MFDTNSVWSRTSTTDPIISDRAYNLSIGFVLFWGFALNFITAMTIPVATIAAIPFWLLLIGYILCCFAGISIYQNSDNPMISFLGYNLIVIPMGIVLTPLVLSYESNIIAQAMATTGGVTLCMMIMGTIYPAFFLSIGRTLFFSLIALIVVELILGLFFNMDSTIFDWIGAGIFSGYIGYDWARANQIPKTLDNAVDSAASLYVDIINLFIRILRILGRSRR